MKVLRPILGLTLSLLATGTAVSAAGPDLAKLPAPAAKKGVTFAKDIRPLFEASCFGCHGAERQKGGLRLDSLEAVLKGSEDGKVLVVGKSKESSLVIAVSHLDEEKAMPPKPKGGRGPGGPGGPGGPRPQGAGGPPPGGGEGRPPGGGPGRGGFGPPPKPLTAEQVGLVRAWIDQGAK